MPVMGFTKFERFFRAAGGVSVDRDDVTRYLDFVNDTVYDLLLIGQATAKANVRDIIEPWDLPVTKGCRKARTGSSASRRRSSSDPYSNRSRPARRSSTRSARRRKRGFRGSSAASAWPWPGVSSFSALIRRLRTARTGNARSASSGCCSERFSPAASGLPG